jgi:hypothetical protein
MPALESTVLTAFLERMAESDRISTVLLQGLGKQLGGAKLPRPEDLVFLYAASSEDIHA